MTDPFEEARHLDAGFVETQAQIKALMDSGWALYEIEAQHAGTIFDGADLEAFMACDTPQKRLEFMRRLLK